MKLKPICVSTTIGLDPSQSEPVGPHKQFINSAKNGKTDGNGIIIQPFLSPLFLSLSISTLIYISLSLYLSYIPLDFSDHRTIKPRLRNNLVRFCESRSAKSCRFESRTFE
ncbi:hypothetical protein LOK49_LG10G02948 [Camellia lanceoleosa]|uniref:Uncharacterized protein n=1 Tax=Camellia lanceoleosa TaxID=1840588 RepID=A0ACC0G856_9ERIC|nr:hypothetical protein LOK49_LG10G02948 [Camellia lanceoleosa]